MSHSKLSIRCPHCRSRAATRSSREITRVYREIYLACTNMVCGHTFKAGMDIIATISPSAIPDPEVVIPYADILRVQAALGMAANDDFPLPANDSEPGEQGRKNEGKETC